MDNELTIKEHIIKCKQCNKNFKIFHYRILTAKFCSRSCHHQSKIGKRSSIKTEFKKGANHSPSTQFQRGHTSFRGPNHWNWKGGVTSFKDKNRHSLEYKEWRKSVFERDDFICQTCFQRGGKLQADHIKMLSTFPWLRYEITNGQTLCKPCHKEKTKNDLSVHYKVLHTLKELIKEKRVVQKEVIIDGYKIYQYKLANI